ncbi:phosphotransferase [Marinactinospora rubrisoli]|uniref:Phosphotransferase n=1 Tax=Marinactinospora rubrisoli TaxID=2715399 RepID=A0ABW2KAJ6_9ACTN
MTEVPLPGGFGNTVVRVGDTVRRTPGERAGFVHELLRLLERRGWPGAPRFHGIDDEGREVLDFIAGHVAWAREQPAGLRSDACLAAVGGLLREFHDLTAGTALAGDREVVCHNDLSPKNTVYRESGAGLRPVAFIDWDLAAPGDRLHDVAHVCWQYAGLGEPGTGVAVAARRIRAVCDGYRLTDRSGLVAAILWWQDRCRRGIESAAMAGEPAMVRLRDSGAAARVRGAWEWVAAHRAALTRLLEGEELSDLA